MPIQSMADRSDEGPTSVWTRWTDDGNVPFHEYCAVLPWDWEETAANDESEIKYCVTPTRQALRLTPFLVALAVISFAIISTLRPEIVGLAEICRQMPIFETDSSVTAVILIIGGLAWTLLLVEILRATKLVTGRTLLKGAFVYGLITLLLISVVLSIYRKSRRRIEPLCYRRQAW